MRKLRRFRELTFDDRQLFMHALLLLPLAKGLLHLGGFNRTYRLFARVFAFRPSTHGERTIEHRAQATMRIVEVAATHGVCRATCLTRSLVAFGLLRRQGFDAQIRLGARKKAGAFEAHAWIALDSVALDPGPTGDADAFVPFSVNYRLNEIDGAVR